MVLVALAAVLAMAGCGGGHAKSGTEGPTKAEYIATADRVCATAQSKRGRLEARVADLAPVTAGETHEVAQLLRKAADAVRVEVHQLRALRPPAADTRTPGSLISFLADEIAHLDGWADAYDERNANGIRGFQAQIAEDSDKAAAVAKQYGFQVCGNPGNGNGGNLTQLRGSPEM